MDSDIVCLVTAARAMLFWGESLVSSVPLILLSHLFAKLCL